MVLFGAYYALCCCAIHAIPRRLATVLASSLYLSALALIPAGLVLLTFG